MSSIYGEKQCQGASEIAQRLLSRQREVAKHSAHFLVTANVIVRLTPARRSVKRNEYIAAARQSYSGVSGKAAQY